MKLKLIVGALGFVARLPFRVLYLISDGLYLAVYYLIGYRKRVVRQNIAEAFPQKGEKERKQIEREFYHFLCDVIVETIKLLNVSDYQLKERIRVVNPEIVDMPVSQGRSAALLLGHYGNWEWVQEITNSFTATAFRASIYHPLKTRLWDEIFKKIRSRWHAHIIPQLSAVRSLLDKAHQPWICGFISDNRPDTFTPLNVTPFLNHYTSFIYGPEVIGKKVEADFFFLEMERVKRGYYEITFHPLNPKDDGKPYPVMREFWCEFEKVIEKSPAYWLWSHKRWKRDKMI